LKRLFPLFALTVLAADPSPVLNLIEAGHFHRARALVDPQALALRARIDLAFNDYPAALQHAEQAVAQDPANADYHFYLAEILGDAARRANKIKAIGLARRFSQELDTALKLNPNHTFALFARMLFYWEAPGLVGGDRKKAFATAAQITAIDPARGNFAYARLAVLQNQPAQAETYYLKAIEANPRYYSALADLANLHRIATPSRYDSAEKYARLAIQVDPGRVRAYTILAETYASAGRLEDLDKVLREAEDHVPDDLTPYYQAAVIVKARAATYLTKYLSREPEAGAPTHAEAKRLRSQR
jgi:tetratricopeptide (TPR) repeat protein